MVESGSPDGEHPLIRSDAHGWLSDVPLNIPFPTPIPIAEGKSIPASILKEALGSEVGVIVASMSIDPRLVSHIIQLTENSTWGNLPTEATSITRVNEDQWEVKVGDYTGRFNRQELEDFLRETLDQPTEE